ncbi:FANCI solenoid 4-domain-containing protein, partial [Gilbertella persicaria]|uniref:FANCI solenoid 4-domain-containing protein n=1 Tax=Gilbertella persicaria TaxID=101096 RepID=UPI0022211541
GYPKMVEPIHLLLANLIKALRVASTQDTTSVTAETMDRFRDVMLSFVDRLSNAKLEDFELDKTVSFDMATHLGRRNNLYAHLVLGVYEICIEYVFMTHGMTAQSTETLLSLFKKRKLLFNVLKDSSTNEKGKKNTQLVISSCVSLEFTSKLFQAVFTQDKTDVVRDLRSDIDFAHFIITSTFDSLKFAIDDVYCHQDDKHFENSIMTCQTYLSILIHEDSDSTFANQQATKKTPSVLSSIAIALRGTLDMVSHVWPERFIEFLRRILNNHTQTTTSTNKVILQLIMQLKDIVLKYLSGRTPIYREASHVMHVCSFLCNKFEKKDTDFSVQSRVVVNWLSELAKERPLEDTGLTKDIIGLLIQLCANMGEFDTILSLSEDVHLFTGDLEVHHTDDDQPLKYSIINTKTFAVITSRLFEFLDASFDDLTWCIGRLKICASEDDQEVSHQFETEVCKRLVLLIFITSELVKSVLTDIHAESLFKTLAKTYKTLHTLVKYKIQFPQDISSQFIQVISKSGTEITDKMYKFLTVYGQSQHHDTGNQTKKNK